MPTDDTPSNPNKDSLAERVAGRVALKGLLRPADATADQASPLPPPATAKETPRPSPEERPAEPVARDTTASGGTEEGSPSQQEQSAPGNSAPHLQINFSRLQNAGFITPTAPQAGVTEEFRVIKRQLLTSAFTDGRKNLGPHSNVVMVTSSLPGEGKTFVSLNLAMSFAAERDLHVLLIDGDSHRHSLSDLLDVHDQAGLVDMLVSPELSARELLLRTNVPNLTFLASGKAHPHGVELMASKRAGALMQDFSARYPDRIIIIDTPPVLASTEATVLASYVGQTIVVVEKNRTSKKSLRRTLEMLEGCPSVSCVLNMASAQSSYTGYDY